MTPLPEPFFLEAQPGTRFCLYHAPDPETSYRGLLVYAPPFAEELNKSRRMVALQARALAAQGFAVLQIDLFGCGDSAGDLADARWEIWIRDLAHACLYGLARHSRPLILWGLRLGALLILDFLKHTSMAVDTVLLWQPVVSGSAHIRQFLRLQRIHNVLNATVASTAEVAGYTLSARLEADIKAVDARKLPPRCRVQWLELAHAPCAPESSAQLIEEWRQAGHQIQHKVLCGPPFWATNEIAISPDLVQATVQALAMSEAET